MPDLYLDIANQPDRAVEAIAAAMETRAADPAMQAICRDYMMGSGLAPRGRILEIGSGGGATTRLILDNLSPRELVGVDPSHKLVKLARETLSGDPHVSFCVGDAGATGAEAESFDAVIAHTVYSHLADADAALAEAHRVLRSGGRLVVFDGDYATITVALYENDPLETLVDAVRRNMVHAPYVMRSLPARVARAGFGDIRTAAHGYVQNEDPAYLVSLLSRGADGAVAAGEIGPELAEGFRREVDRRVAEGLFYGAVLFVSLDAGKPAD